jgi:hypothetical protein
MGSKSAWRCRACALPLGSVRCGALYPAVPVERVERGGAVVVRCPCGEEKVWIRTRHDGVLR